MDQIAGAMGTVATLVTVSSQTLALHHHLNIADIVTDLDIDLDLGTKVLTNNNKTNLTRKV